jgi:hypothetical protein
MLIEENTTYVIFYNDNTKGFFHLKNNVLWYCLERSNYTVGSKVYTIDKFNKYLNSKNTFSDFIKKINTCCKDEFSWFHKKLKGKTDNLPPIVNEYGI